MRKRYQLKEVHAASEMLGIDPFEVANEGKVIMSVQPEKPMKSWKPSEKKIGDQAQIIGEVTEDKHVILETAMW